MGEARDSIGLAETQTLEPPLLPPRVHVSRIIELGVERLKPRHSDMGCGHPNLAVNHSNSYSETLFFLPWQKPQLFVRLGASHFPLLSLY